MRALPEVQSASFDIASETFTIELVDAGASEAVLLEIKRLGFQPAVLDESPAVAPIVRRVDPLRATSLRDALTRAAKRNVPLLVDFGGAFCPSCKAFERDVLSNPRVITALEAFEVLRIDIADDKAAAEELGVAAVPDVWIIDADLAVLARENRTMNVEEFLSVLRNHAPK